MFYIRTRSSRSKVPEREKVSNLILAEVEEKGGKIFSGSVASFLLVFKFIDTRSIILCRQWEARSFKNVQWNEIAADNSAAGSASGTHASYRK